MVQRNFFVEIRDFVDHVRGMTPEQRKCCSDSWERMAMGDPIGVPRSCTLAGAACPIKGLNEKMPGNLEEAFSPVEHLHGKSPDSLSRADLPIGGLDEKQPDNLHEVWRHQLECKIVMAVAIPLLLKKELVGLYRVVKVVTRGGALTGYVVLKIVWTLSKRMVIFLGKKIIALGWLVIQTMRVVNVRTLHLIGMVAVAAVVAYTHFGRGQVTLDWFTFGLGAFCGSITFLVLGDLEGQMEFPLPERFLASSCIGSTLASYVGRMSFFDREDFDMRVLVYGGAAVWMTGIQNLNLFLQLSDMVVNPFRRLAVAVGAGITIATVISAFYYRYILAEQVTELPAYRRADLGKEGLESGILIYASVSTWPLLLRFIKVYLAHTQQ